MDVLPLLCDEVPAENRVKQEDGALFRITDASTEWWMYRALCEANKDEILLRMFVGVSMVVASILNNRIIAPDWGQRKKNAVST